MKFWGFICNRGWRFSEWAFPNVWEIFIQLNMGQILLWSILFALSRQGLVGKKHWGPDILPLTHKAVGEDALTMIGESRLGHLMSKVLKHLQVLPHTHPHTPHTTRTIRRIVKELPSHGRSESGTFSWPPAPLRNALSRHHLLLWWKPWGHLVPSYILETQDNPIDVPTHIPKLYMKEGMKNRRGNFFWFPNAGILITLARPLGVCLLFHNILPVKIKTPFTMVYCIFF